MRSVETGMNLSGSLQNHENRWNAYNQYEHSPSRDGAHRDTTFSDWLWNCVISRTGNALLSHDGEATAAGACLHDQKERQSFWMFSTERKN